MSHAKCEVLINFMYENINRFLSLPDQAVHLDELFGSNEWRVVQGLSLPEQRLRSIHDLYLGQLRKVARYVRSFQMMNSSNRVEYVLFFATKDLLGLEKMKESMWRADPRGEFQFSDYTNSSAQLRLFAEEPDYDALRRLIAGKYTGEQTSIDDLENWVIADTPFLRTHIRTNVLVPMEREGAVSVLNPKSGRRKGAFPEGAILKFS